MFAQMVSTLRSGSLPDQDLLRRRFNAALVKKMGVIKTPYSFWPSDTKINPPAKELLWAAILLHDPENFSLVEAIISTELAEKSRAQGHPASAQELGVRVQQCMQAYIEEFIGLAPAEELKQDLRQMAAALFPGPAVLSDG